MPLNESIVPEGVVPETTLNTANQTSGRDETNQKSSSMENLIPNLPPTIPAPSSINDKQFRIDFDKRVHESYRPSHSSSRLHYS